MKKKVFTKKRLTGALALVMAAALILGGTFAWSDIAQMFSNVFQSKSYQAELVDVFTEPTDWEAGQEVNKDVYVKNIGTGDIFVRVQFKEIFKYLANQSGTEVQHNPAFADINKPSINDAKNMITWVMGETGKDVKIKTVSEFAGVEDAWFYDTDTGWFYWGNPLSAGEQTQQILDAVKLNSDVELEGDLYYVINVYMNAFSCNKEGINGTTAGLKGIATLDGANLSANTLTMVKMIAGLLTDAGDKANLPAISDQPGMSQSEKDKAIADIIAGDLDKVVIDNPKQGYELVNEINKKLEEENAKNPRDEQVIADLTKAAESIERITDGIMKEYGGKMPENTQIIITDSGYAALADNQGNVLIDAVNFPDAQLIKMLKEGFDTAKYNTLYSISPNPVVADVSTTSYTNYTQPSIDTNADGKLSQTELDAITTLYFNNYRVVGASTPKVFSPDLLTSLKGLEMFSNLEILQAQSFDIVSFNAPANPKLKNLLLASYELSDIDVTRNPDLEDLMINGAKIQSIDLSRNTKLKLFAVSNSLDLQALDLSANKDLESITALNNSLLSQINVNGLSKLKFANIANNPLITSFDAVASGLTSLETLSVYTTRTPAALGGMTSLNVKGLTTLKTLNAYNQSFTSLDVSGCTSLETLSAYVTNTADWYGAFGHGPLTSLNLTGCSALKTLSVGCQSLTSLNCDELVNVTSISAYNNNLSSVSLNGCASLVTLYLQNDATYRAIDDNVKNHISTLNIRDTAITSNSTAFRFQNNGIIELLCKAGFNYTNANYHKAGNTLTVTPGA